MDFDALVDVLRGFIGKTVEATVSIPIFDDGAPVPIAGLAFGKVVSVKLRPLLDHFDVCILWLDNERSLWFRRSLYIGADFIANRQEEDFSEGEYDPEDRSGTDWTLSVRQSGVMTTITVYV